MFLEIQHLGVSSQMLGADAPYIYALGNTYLGMYSYGYTRHSWTDICNAENKIEQPREPIELISVIV